MEWHPDCAVLVLWHQTIRIIVHINYKNLDLAHCPAFRFLPFIRSFISFSIFFCSNLVFCVNKNNKIYIGITYCRCLGNRSCFLFKEWPFLYSVCLLDALYTLDSRAINFHTSQLFTSTKKNVLKVNNKDRPNHTKVIHRSRTKLEWRSLHVMLFCKWSAFHWPQSQWTRRRIKPEFLTCGLYG